MATVKCWEVKGSGLMEGYYTLPLLSGAYVIAQQAPRRKRQKQRLVVQMKSFCIPKKTLFKKSTAWLTGVVSMSFMMELERQPLTRVRMIGNYISIKRNEAMAIGLFRVFVEVDRPIINVRLTLNIVYTSVIRLPNTSLNSVEKTLSALLRSRIKMLGIRIGKLKTRKTTENWKIFRTLS